MRKEVHAWLGKELLFLSAEAQTGGTAAEQTAQIFERFQNELQQQGLSLDNTVRTRLWGKDRESRDDANTVRFNTLTGDARSVSSSYYSPSHFDSDARVAMDLWALRPSHAGLAKTLKEYDPSLIPLRYLIYDSVVFLSGVTAILPTLEDQLANILPRISESLRDAGSSWEQAAKASFYLHRTQSLEKLRDIFRQSVKNPIPQMEYAFVDGYSNPGKLIEIEVTAIL